MSENNRLALVTGASSGIGEAFARRLAKDGYNLIIVARRKERLDTLSKELNKTYGVTVESIGADLTVKEQLLVVEKRIKETGGLDFLVNNAGLLFDGGFVDVDIEDHEQMMLLNMHACARLMRIALPDMIKRDKGTIINVSSIAGFLPRPGNVNYGATKAYVTFLTDGVSQGLSGTGIKMQTLCPGLTRTELFRNQPSDRKEAPGFIWMSSEEVVTESFKALSKGKLICIPGLKNRVIIRAYNMIQILPKQVIWLIRSIVRKVLFRKQI